MTAISEQLASVGIEAISGRTNIFGLSVECEMFSASKAPLSISESDLRVLFPGYVPNNRIFIPDRAEAIYDGKEPVIAFVEGSVSSQANVLYIADMYQSPGKIKLDDGKILCNSGSGVLGLNLTEEMKGYGGFGLTVKLVKTRSNYLLRFDVNCL